MRRVRGSETGYGDRHIAVRCRAVSELTRIISSPALDCAVQHRASVEVTGSNIGCLRNPCNRYRRGNVCIGTIADLTFAIVTPARRCAVAQCSTCGAPPPVAEAPPELATPPVAEVPPPAVVPPVVPPVAVVPPNVVVPPTAVLPPVLDVPPLVEVPPIAVEPPAEVAPATIDDPPVLDAPAE